MFGEARLLLIEIDGGRERRESFQYRNCGEVVNSNRAYYCDPNNAAQVWNHNMYWLSMAPNGGGEPKAGSKVAAAINDSFGSFGDFAEAFKKAGATQFGSGWAWLVSKGGKLEVRKTPNAECPLTDEGVTTLLTMDVWEHAYYLDYQNKRPDYMEHFLANLANWAFAEQQLAGA